MTPTQRRILHEIIPTVRPGNIRMKTMNLPESILLRGAENTITRIRRLRVRESWKARESPIFLQKLNNGQRGAKLRAL